MKKQLLLIITLALIIGLAGCGKQQTVQNEIGSSPAVSQSADVPSGNEESDDISAETSSQQAKETDSDTSGEVATESTPTTAATTAEEKKTETQAIASEPTATETKQAEIKDVSTETKAPPETESSTEQTKTEEKPSETKPAETVSTTPPTRPSAAEIEQLVAVYLNEHRNAQGVVTATVLPGLTEVARFRAEQLITNFSHYSDPDACTVLKYGEFIDMTQYGFSESDNYYQGYDAEACAKGNWTGTAEDIARKIADGFRNSSGHWRYVGDSQYGYMAVGLTYDNHTAKWYCCVCVSSQNYGG